MRQTLSPVREKVFRLQPASSNTITRPAALNIVSSVAITVLTCTPYAPWLPSPRLPRQRQEVLPASSRAHREFRPTGRQHPPPPRRAAAHRPSRRPPAVGPPALRP